MLALSDENVIKKLETLISEQLMNEVAKLHGIIRK